VKYMMFVVADPCGGCRGSTLRQRPDHRRVARRGGGRRVTGDARCPVDDATTVRVSEGEVLVSDGPFTESKEWIADFDILECEDLDEVEVGG
jgi:hypothetical protein